MIGQTISHYKILEKLGEGGMGVVYKAEDTNLHRSVALKFLSHGKEDGLTASARFAREARAAASLNHPNIATIYEYSEVAYPGTNEKQSFIAMEYVEGETLKQRIDRGPLSVDDAIGILYQVAQGLRQAHQSGIIHRDIKPANIIITHDGRVKILDFGVAKITQGTSITQSYNIVGSCAYMSPEQIAGTKVDARSDIWSLGIVLFEMLTGKIPFRGEFAPAMMYSITNEAPLEISAFRNDVPEYLQRLYKQCLEKDRALRPQSISEILIAIESKKPVKRSDWFSRGLGKRIAVVTSSAILIGVIVWLMIPKIFQRSEPQQTTWKLAILPFENLTDNQDINSWGRSIQNLYVNELTGVEGIGVIDPISFNGFLESSLGSLQAPRGSNFARTLKISGATMLITGNIAKSKNEYSVQTKLVDPVSDEVKFSQDAIAVDETMLPAVVAQSSKQILEVFQVMSMRRGKDEDLRPWLSQRKQNIAAVKAFVEAANLIYHQQDGAGKYLQNALESDSDYIAARVWLISTLVRKREIQQAEQHLAYLHTLEKKASPFERAMINWASAYMKHDYASMIVSLEHALAYTPDNVILLYNLAVARVQLDDYEGAKEALMPVVDRQWQFSTAHYLLGVCYDMSKQYTLAQQTLEQSLNIKPVYPESFSMLAVLHYRFGDTVKEQLYADKFEQRLRYENSADTIAKRLGDAYLFEGYTARAKTQYQRAIGLKPGKAVYHAQVAETCLQLGEAEEAKRESMEALRLDPSLQNATFTLGQAYYSLHDTMRALTTYKKYLQADSTSALADTAKDKIAKLLH